MDVVTLAASTVGPLLVPYLKQGADKLAESIGANLGEGAAKQITSAAKGAWELVKGAFKSEQEIITLGLFEKDPETFQEPVRRMLEDNLKKDPQLTEKLDALLSLPGPSGSTSSVINNAVNAGILNMQGASISNVSGTVFAGVNIGGSNLPNTADRSHGSGPKPNSAG